VSLSTIGANARRKEKIFFLAMSACETVTVAVRHLT